MGKIFGTDGVRGLSNTYPMTSEVALKIGMAAAYYLGNFNSKTNRVVIGKDTRLSGYMLETAITAGLASMGKDVFLLGPMPTHGVAMLIRSVRADLGIMISASHNSYYDNGIKIFDKSGYKLSDNDENRIEELLQTDFNDKLVKPEHIGKVTRLKEAYGRYLQYAKSVVPNRINFSGLKIVVDCANGANYRLAPEALFELGAEVVAIGNKPNGTNINKNCGSTSLDLLCKKVLEEKADIGIAFDGDADRVIFVDEKANIINGDKILAVIATNLKKQNLLNHNKVVGTIMANMGFERYLKSQGIDLIRTAVGDRYVHQKILEENLSIGGEQSGHIIIPSIATTGDGLISALKILTYLSLSNRKASDFFNLYQDMPQVLKNIPFKDTNPLENSKVIDFIEDLQKYHSHSIRILVRKSGTEKLIRVMVEGEDSFVVDKVSQEIVSFIK